MHEVKTYLIGQSNVREVSPGKFEKIEDEVEGDSPTEPMDLEGLRSVMEGKKRFDPLQDGHSYSQVVKNKLHEWLYTMKDPVTRSLRASLQLRFIMYGIKGDELTNRKLARKTLDACIDLLCKEQLTPEEISSLQRSLYVVRRYV